MSMRIAMKRIEKGGIRLKNRTKRKRRRYKTIERARSELRTTNRVSEELGQVTCARGSQPED